jgi:hypothetical protein
VIRKQSSYQVGEIVAYHNRDLKAVVLHRIIARDGSKYVFKGDNNQFADLYEANASDLIGEKVVYSPSAGRVLLGLRNPIIGAALFGAFAVWMLWDFAAEGDAPRHRRPNRRRPNRRRQAVLAPPAGPGPEPAMARTPAMTSAAPVGAWTTIGSAGPEPEAAMAQAPAPLDELNELDKLFV